MFLTPNLHLRALDPETDTTFLLQWRNDVTFVHAMRTEPAVPCARPQAKEFVEKLANREATGLPIFAVCERFPDGKGKVKGSEGEEFYHLENPHEDLFKDGTGETRYPMIGVLNINQGDGWHWANRACSIGVALHESVTGRGYGTELMTWACDYIFNSLGLHRITLRADGDNARAIRCYEKIGYVREGLNRKTHWRDGRWNDTVVLGMLEEDWARIKEERKA